MAKKGKSNFWRWLLGVGAFILIGTLVLLLSVREKIANRKMDQIKEKKRYEENAAWTKKWEAEKAEKAKKMVAHYAGSRNGLMNNMYFYHDGSCEFSVYTSDDFKNLHMGCKSETGSKDWTGGNKGEKGYYYFRGNQIVEGIEYEHLFLNVYYYNSGERSSDRRWSEKVFKGWSLYESRHRENGLMVGGANIREEWFNPPLTLLRKK